MARNPFLPNNEENHSNSQQSSGKIILKPAGVGAYKVCGPNGFEFSFDIVVDNIKIMVSGLSESPESLQDGTNEQVAPGFDTSTPTAASGLVLPPPFGVPAPTVPSAPGFGTSAPTAPSAPGFGTSTPTAPGFGASTTTTPGFGLPTPSAPGFGASAPTAPSAPGFGTSTPSAPGFGTSIQSAPGFGTSVQSAPGFDTSAQSAPGFDK